MPGGHGLRKAFPTIGVDDEITVPALLLARTAGAAQSHLQPIEVKRLAGMIATKTACEANGYSGAVMCRRDRIRPWRTGG